MGVVFVGSYGPTGLRSVCVDPGSGRLDITAALPVPDVSWLHSHDGRLYATNERDDGTVTVLDATTLAVLDTVDSHGAEPTHVSVFGGYLLVANHGSGVAVVGPDGRASDVVPGVRAHQMLTDPSGRWVLAVFLGTDSIHVYRLVDGRLVVQQRVDAAPGPRHLVWHGDCAYVICENGPVVLTCSWDADAGRLTVLNSVGTGAAGDYPGEGVLSSDGRFLYVTNRGSNTISTFDVGDRPRRLADVSTGGDWPRHAVLDPDERRLYVSNQRSGTVTWLPRDPATGVLSDAAGELAVPGVAMVLFP